MQPKINKVNKLKKKVCLNFEFCNAKPEDTSSTLSSFKIVSLPSLLQAPGKKELSLFVDIQYMSINSIQVIILFLPSYPDFSLFFVYIICQGC